MWYKSHLDAARSGGERLCQKLMGCSFILRTYLYKATDGYSSNIICTLAGMCCLSILYLLSSLPGFRCSHLLSLTQTRHTTHRPACNP
jgi:hypothetical protein